jgi:hypothetical protein
LVLRDTSTGEILCVLDTKYKDTTTPATDDVAQIVAYAEKMGCQEAILVYPRGLPRPFEARVAGGMCQAPRVSDNDRARMRTLGACRIVTRAT